MTDKTPVNPQSNASKEVTFEHCDKEKFVLEHIDWMLRLAERIVCDHALAQDVVQESFINIIRSYNTLRDRSRPKPWLKRIVVNTALMQLRQKKRQSEKPIDDFLPEFDRNDCRVEGRWYFLAKTEDVVENLHLQSSINDSFSKLPEEHRIVLLLRDIEGYDSNEVASMLDITPGNVRIRLHRARSALKTLIEPILRGDIC